MLNLLQAKQVKNAANLLISAISIFSAEEIIPYDEFSTLCFILAAGFLPRDALKRLQAEQMDAFGAAQPLAVELV